MKRHLFVPVKGKQRAADNESGKDEEFTGFFSQMKSVLDNERNSVQQILDFCGKENERAREHELLLFHMFPQPNPTLQSYVESNTSSTPQVDYHAKLACQPMNSNAQPMQFNINMDFHYGNQGQIQQNSVNSFIWSTSKPLASTTNYGNLSPFDTVSPCKYFK